MEKRSRPKNRRYANSHFEVVDAKTITDAIKDLKDKLGGLVRDYDIEGARHYLGELSRLSNLYTEVSGGVEDEILRVHEDMEKKCTAAQFTLELFQPLCETCLSMFEHRLPDMPLNQNRKIDFLSIRQCSLCALIWRRLSSSDVPSVENHEMDIRYSFKLHPFFWSGTYCINFELIHSDTGISFNALLLQLNVGGQYFQRTPQS